MANFSIANSTTAGFGSTQGPIGATYRSICMCAASSQAGGTNGSNLRRGKVYDILVGGNGAPVDASLEWNLSRATMLTSPTAWAGTLASLSCLVSLDPADGGALGGNIIANASAETNLTAGAQLWYVAINQRASYRWVAAPGSEFVYPATSSNGFTLQSRNTAGSYTSFVSGTILLSEQ